MLENIYQIRSSPQTKIPNRYKNIQNYSRNLFSCLSKSNTFFYSCDFLYWKAQNTGWLYGILVSGNGKESSSTNERESKDTKEIYISSTQSIQQKLLRGDFNFDFGSRLGFGYKFFNNR